MGSVCENIDEWSCSYERKTDDLQRSASNQSCSLSHCPINNLRPARDFVIIRKDKATLCDVKHFSSMCFSIMKNLNLDESGKIQLKDIPDPGVWSPCLKREIRPKCRLMHQTVVFLARF